MYFYKQLAFLRLQTIALIMECDPKNKNSNRLCWWHELTTSKPPCYQKLRQEKVNEDTRSKF